MKIKSAKFVCSAPNLAACPESPLYEVALIGRSNVGKSSLINTLTEQKSLALVSAVPGKTRLINFFAINGDWHLVDLPGYGFAKAGKLERADFHETVAAYIEERPNLALVLVLIDSRLPPQRIDLEFVQWLAGREVPFAFVFTKADKMKPRALEASVGTFLEAVEQWCPGDLTALVSSSKDRTGRREILGHIESCLAAAGAEE